MSLDISSLSLVSLSESELELEELELLPPDGPSGGGATPLGGLLSLDSVALDLAIEPLPDCTLRGGAGRSYSESMSSLSGIVILPSGACYSRMLSITDATSISFIAFCAD
jgi:hypothetical protein